MRPPQETEKEAIVKGILCDDPAHPIEGFSAYFRLYESELCTPSFESTIIQVDNPAFSSHEDVLECARRLRLNPAFSRGYFARALFPGDHISAKDKEDAIRSIVRVSFMLDCSLKDKYSEGFEVGGYSPARWETNESLVSYVERAIPKCPIQQGNSVVMQRYKKTVRAWKLKKRYKLKFRPTDNIMEHLLYDPVTRVVHVFHHTAYLKSHLARSLNSPIDLGASESLKLGTLPPQLLVETLHSLHFILFPITVDRSGRSRRLLKRLIRKYNFDANAQWDEGSIRALPEDFGYQYWGSRLEKLCDIANKPPPANHFVSWIERHTTERNALTVAIIGLFLSALFGILGFIVGLAQLWIAIVAWKHPQGPS